jgi:hypothetical protein
MKDTEQTGNVKPAYRILALPTDADGQAWVTLVKCGSVLEADFLRSRLESEGIAVFVPDENLMAAAGWALNEFGYVRVQVAGHDYEKARELLVASGDAVAQ